MGIGIPQLKLLIRSGKNEVLGPGMSPPVPRASQWREGSLSGKGHPDAGLRFGGRAVSPSRRGPGISVRGPET